MNRDLTVWLYFLLPFVALLISFVEIYTVEWSTNVGLCRLCVTSLLQFAGFIYFVLVESSIIVSSEYEDRRSS